MHACVRSGSSRLGLSPLRAGPAKGGTMTTGFFNRVAMVPPLGLVLTLLSVRSHLGPRPGLAVRDLHGSSP